MNRNTESVIWNATALFISYLAVATPLPLISVFVKSSLQLSNAFAGLAVGISFLSTLLTRNLAGRFTDASGGKRSFHLGLILYSIASLICLVAFYFSAFKGSYLILILGRLLLGVGESFTMVGVLSWNISLIGPKRSGIVFSLVGASIYGAYALGGPMGIMLLNKFGFCGLILCVIPLPLLGLAMTTLILDDWTAPEKIVKSSFLSILSKIWKLGLIVGLQIVGFAALAAFISLFFTSQGWDNAGLGLSFFGGGFILIRLVGGSLPDRLGGKLVVLVSLAIEALGQGFLWLAPSANLALLGAFLTGVGSSLVFPAMGVELIKRVSPELKGTALGGFSIFSDLAYAFTAPIAGLFADYFGYSVVFLLGLIMASLGILLALSLESVTYRQDNKAETEIMANN